jgi:hypothetical protein
MCQYATDARTRRTDIAPRRGFLDYKSLDTNLREAELGEVSSLNLPDWAPPGSWFAHGAAISPHKNEGPRREGDRDRGPNRHHQTGWAAGMAAITAPIRGSARRKEGKPLDFSHETARRAEPGAGFAALLGSDGRRSCRCRDVPGWFAIIFGPSPNLLTRGTRPALDGASDPLSAGHRQGQGVTTTAEPLRRCHRHPPRATALR